MGAGKSLFVLALIVLVLNGCNSNQHIEEANESSHSEPLVVKSDKPCEFNKEYPSEESCICTGIGTWSIHKNVSRDNKCTHLNSPYICRRIVENRVEGEIVAEILENASLESVKLFMVENGLQLIRFPCNMSDKRWGYTIVVFVGNNNLQESINKMEKTNMMMGSHAERMVGVNLPELKITFANSKLILRFNNLENGSLKASTTIFNGTSLIENSEFKNYFDYRLQNISGRFETIKRIEISSWSDLNRVPTQILYNRIVSEEEAMNVSTKVISSLSEEWYIQSIKRTPVLLHLNEDTFNACMYEKSRFRGNFAKGEVVIRFMSNVSESQAKSVIEPYGLDWVDFERVNSDNSSWVRVNVPQNEEIEWACELENSNKIMRVSFNLIGGFA